MNTTTLSSQVKRQITIWLKSKGVNAIKIVKATKRCVVYKIAIAGKGLTTGCSFVPVAVFKTAKETVFCLVQHSAFLVNGDRRFISGCEAASFDLTAAQIDLLKTKGVRLFETWTEATDAEKSENYQADNRSWFPKVLGRFINLTTVTNKALYVL